MSTVAKILVVVNLALAAAFVGSASTYLGNQDHWKQKYETSKKKLDQDVKDLEAVVKEKEGLVDEAQAARGEAENRADKEQARANELSTQNQHLRSSYDQKTAQLTRLTAAAERMASTIEANQQAINSLKDLNRTQHDAYVASEQSLNSAREQVDRLSMQLTNETEKSKALEGQIANLSEDLERAKFELRSWSDRYPGGGPMGAAQPAHIGQILAANNQDNVFVISLGAEDGVEAGFEYTVSRGNKYVGTIRIRDVQSKQAAGISVKDMQANDIQRGDQVMSAR